VPSDIYGIGNALWKPESATLAPSPLPPQDRELLQAAFDKAIEALSDPDCRGIFGTRGTRLDPATVLTSIKEGGQYGSIKFEKRDSDFGAARTYPSGFPRLSTATVFRFPKVSIVINSYNDDQGVYWNDGDVSENTETLLHELGHALWFLGVRGGQFRQRDGSEENQQFNRNLINENCLKKIQW